MAFRVEVDIAACIGCVACTRCENFEMKADGKAYAVKSEVDDLRCSEEAAEVCPVGAIKVSKSGVCS
jgi:ferredoxin